MSNHFCVLCGAIIVPFHFNTDRVPTDQLGWTSEVRGVLSSWEHGPAVVTGVGYVVGTALVANTDYDTTYLGGDETRYLHSLKISPPNRRAFAFHSACWEILLSRVTDRRYPSGRPPGLEGRLADLLCCLPVDRYGFLLVNHDFGGARQFWTSFGPPPCYEDQWSFISANPLGGLVNESNWADLISPEPDSLGVHQPQVDLLCRAAAFKDSFSKLPAEVLVMILTMLESPDISSLRLSSHVVAQASHVSHLPQSFWASRFEKGSEMAFFFACFSPPDAQQTVDWRGLYAGIRQYLANRSSDGCLASKRRIWNSLSPIVATLTALLNAAPVGSKRGLDINDIVQGMGVPNVRLVEDWFLQSLETRPYSFDTRYILAPHYLSANVVRIAVSFISFDCKPYVCGIQFLSGDGKSGGGSYNHFSAGWIYPNTAQEALLVPGERLVGLGVATLLTGVVGLRFFTQKPGVSGQAEHTFGSWDTSTTRVCIGKLVPRRGAQISGFKCVLDPCKFASVQILESPSAPTSLEREEALEQLPPSREGQEDLTVPLWSPHAPATGLDTTVVLPYHPKRDDVEDDQGSTIYFNMDFAGPNGARLSLLNRVVGLIDTKLGQLLGLAFVYDDGKELLFGTNTEFHCIDHSRRCAELSFPIQGSRGERVVEIQVAYNICKLFQLRHVLGAVTLSTNMGNSFVFQNYVPTRQPEWEPDLTFRPPEGQVITGIIAEIKHHGEPFQNLGYHSMSIENLDRQRLVRNLLSAKVDRTFPFSDLRVSGGGLGLCMTTVYLSDVKNIRISSGLNGHTREPEHISGLWFDFWGSDRSVIVGQWINQVGLFEFAAEEQIANLVICRSPPVYVSSVTGSKLLDSRVTGLRLVTSGGAKKELQLSNADNISEEHHSTNPAEALFGIIWVFDYMYDVVRVTTHVKDDSQSLPPPTIIEGRRVKVVHR